MQQFRGLSMGPIIPGIPFPAQQQDKMQLDWQDKPKFYSQSWSAGLSFPVEINWNERYIWHRNCFHIYKAYQSSLQEKATSFFQCTCKMLNKNSSTLSTWYLKRDTIQMYFLSFSLSLVAVASNIQFLLLFCLWWESSVHSSVPMPTLLFFLTHYSFPLVLGTVLSHHHMPVSISFRFQWESFPSCHPSCVIFVWQLQCVKFLFTYLPLCWFLFLCN